MDDFVFRALLAGVGVALASVPLGVFVVWRRMAYFGGALSHTAILGFALGVWLEINPLVGVVAVVVVSALMLSLSARPLLGSDTVLGIIAHGALALGLVGVSMLKSARIDLMAFLFGDILSVGGLDVALIWLAAITGGVVSYFIWGGLLSATVHAELARVEGVRVRVVETVFVLLLAVVVSLAIKVVGILLVASLLIIPPASARRFSSTPEGMLVLAGVAATLSVLLGVGASLEFDWPAGPAIVVMMCGFYLAGLLKKPG